MFPWPENTKQLGYGVSFVKNLIISVFFNWPDCGKFSKNALLIFKIAGTDQKSDFNFLEILIRKKFFLAVTLNRLVASYGRDTLIRAVDCKLTKSNPVANLKKVLLKNM